MLDEFDRKILAALQVDSSLSVQEVADRVGLSSTPCWRRIQKLESLGYIRGRVALLNADKLNVGVSVFIAVKTNQHNACLLYTSPSPRDRTRSRMPSSA